ncbi:hypothetical protein CBR_g23274 [Chara braunii]|uniref:Uncharacterized protein n=1 Tax=Chara braunii TaxID=69332 RepID=A0A388JVF7_CHABU|nr:hypothetical protein CBR_g23274 [Chara braunii]|eukprot:GBG61760.1 hypothetical protein CBR_g23274 [Chara braunii]
MVSPHVCFCARRHLYSVYVTHLAILLLMDIVHYLRTGTNCTGAVRGAILQAPVSDREYMATLPRTKEFLEVAEKMIAEGRKNDVMPLDANNGIPITAFRYHSLAGVGGEDDMFSSDLTIEELVMKLGHMAMIQTQVVFSMADEYIPDHVDKRALLDR